MPQAPSFAWPPSTRLSYQLNGYYRGPVTGRAQVEWLRSGNRYQVRMGTSIGLIVSRDIVSEGELTERGLVPQRFSAEQKVVLREARRWAIRFDRDSAVAVDGQTLATPAGVQDEASQFVQLTWLFTVQPQRLQPGESVELPLLLTRRVDRWVYDVVATETLQFPFGAVPAVHVKPRRPATGNDMSAEIWFAPGLQHLPVRILIRYGTDSWADLMLERAPQQAER